MKNRIAKERRDTINDWIIEGNFISTTYQIKSGDTVLMVVKDKIGTMATDPYYVDIMDQKNELLCLLVAIAIDAAKSTKSEEMKFARKQLIKRILSYSEVTEEKEKERIEKTKKAFTGLKDSGLSVFIKNLDQMNIIHNKPCELVWNQDAMYVCTRNEIEV